MALLFHANMVGPNLATQRAIETDGLEPVDHANGKSGKG